MAPVRERRRGWGGEVISYVVIASEGFRLLPAPTQLCEVINIEI